MNKSELINILKRELTRPTNISMVCLHREEIQHLIKLLEEESLEKGQS